MLEMIPEPPQFAQPAPGLRSHTAKKPDAPAAAQKNVLCSFVSAASLRKRTTEMSTSALRQAKNAGCGASKPTTAGEKALMRPASKTKPQPGCGYALVIWSR